VILSGERGRQIGTVALIAVLIGVLFFTTFRWLGIEWWSNDYYTHGPLVLLVSGFLVWRRRAGLQRESPSNWGLLGITAGLAIHVIGLALRAPYLSALSLPILLGGLVAFLLGLPALRRVAFPLAFLWLAIPLPFVEAASVPLQNIAASASTALARMVGIPAEVRGAQISLTTCDLQVGAACSGLRSIVALLTLVVIFVYLLQGSLPAKLLLLALATPIAILANVIRITGLLIIAENWGQDAGLKYFHDYSSPVLFLVAFVLLIALSWVLKCREIRSDI